MNHDYDASGTKGPNETLAARFIFGINCPWFGGAFDHDLGRNPAHPNWGCWYNPGKVTDYFHDIRGIGFSVVRVWLMEGAEGLTIGNDGIITGLDGTFLEHLEDVVRRAHHESLRLYLCLTTSWKWRDGAIPSPVTNREQQHAYLTKAVRPIIRRFKGNETIFAFDIFNEIESEWLDEAINFSKASKAQTMDFIRQNAVAIKEEDPARLVSAGSGWKGWSPIQDGDYCGLGLDFYDFHVFRDDGYLPHVDDLNADRPVIVGECNVRNDRDDPEADVFDDLQKECLATFLRNAVAKGYSGCFVWAYYTPTRGIANYLDIVRCENGQHRPSVQAIRQIIQAHST
jgi:Cellulase (glycosyl hydrolase family 5)